MQLLCSYLICATPHSGSTLLCEALKNTGSAGWPEEYFAVVKNTPIQEPLARYPQPGEDMVGEVELTTQNVLYYLHIPIPDTHQFKQDHSASVLANSRPLRSVVCETQWA